VGALGSTVFLKKIKLKNLSRYMKLKYGIMLSSHGAPLRPYASKKVREFCRPLIESEDNA
jgi:hypothetical protein